MFIVTFYSYKGGVGRTLALVNVAIRLASKGKRVFILDFDLEAPGVDAFQLSTDSAPRQGLVEYIARYKQCGAPPPLGDYVTDISTGRVSPGMIRMMTAGTKDKNYQLQLSRLDWKFFYHEQHGFAFVENLKSAIDHEFSPDYVLIDSRTGLTDVSGICTLQLPDLVVFLFNLNNQNLAGISQIYRSVRFNKLDREIDTLLIASPIPDVSDFGGLRSQRLEQSKKLLGAQPDIILPYDPFVAFEETLLWESDFQTNLSKAYSLLCDAIIDKNGKDVLTLLKEARRLRDQGNLEVADLQYQELVESTPSNPEVWVEYGLFQRMRGKLDGAGKAFLRASELDPQNSKPLFQLCTTLLAMEKGNEASSCLKRFLALSPSPKEIVDIAAAFDKAGMLEGAIAAYERANEIGENPSIHLEVGNIYMAMKKPKEAVAHFQRASELSPTGLPYIYNSGYALMLLGDDRAAEYFKRAVDLFEQRAESRSRTGTDANAHQAMSHAYLALGNLKEAREQLEMALAIVKNFPMHSRVFSSIQYRYIGAKMFQAETMQLLHKLHKKT